MDFMSYAKKKLIKHCLFYSFCLATVSQVFAVLHINSLDLSLLVVTERENLPLWHHKWLILFLYNKIHWFNKNSIQHVLNHWYTWFQWRIFEGKSVWVILHVLERWKDPSTLSLWMFQLGCKKIWICLQIKIISSNI